MKSSSSLEIKAAKISTSLCKRSADVSISILALALSSPLWLLIFFLNPFFNAGPLVYRHKRAGLHGHSFALLKFRSMKSDSSGLAITAAGDSRITPLGSWLRKTKLDEIPQFWNVLKGEMSLVGPRPEAQDIVERHYSPEAKLTLLVKPGLISEISESLLREEDLLQQASDPMKFYVEALLPQKIHSYLNYIHNWKIFYDTKIILRFILSSLKG